MTSTSFNLGYHCDKKTSRVLRPPGGGHTNIFGPAEPEPVRRDHGRNASSISEGTNPTQNHAPLCPQKVAEPQKTERPPQQQPTRRQEPEAAQARTRVPPGGFSSGLW